MPIKTLYVLNTTAVTPNFWGNLQEDGTAPADAICTYGYGVGTNAPGYWRSFLGATAVGNTHQSFSYLDEPAYTPPVKGLGAGVTPGSSAAGDSFRAGPFSGTFASGNWNLGLRVASPVATARGFLRYSIWRSPNADGTAATFLGIGDGNEVVMAIAGAPYTSNLTFFLPSPVTFNDDYLFIKCEWRETVAGTAAGCEVRFYQGGKITTGIFTQTASTTMHYVYEPQYVRSGWEDGNGLTMPSWWDRDLTGNLDGSIILLAILDVVDIFLDDDVFYAGPSPPVQLPPDADNRPRPMLPAQDQPHITVEVYHPKMFIDDDLFFIPMAVRALDTPDKMLKNEVIRTR